MSATLKQVAHFIEAVFLRVLFAWRSFDLNLGEMHKLNSMGYDHLKNEKVGTLNVWRNKYNHAGVRILFDPKREQSVLIRFSPWMSIYEFGVELWYEHSLDAMPGPTWHHSGGGAGGDKVFDGTNDTILQQSVSALRGIFSSKTQIPWVVRHFYLNRVLHILEFLLSPEGKAFRAQHAETRSMYEQRALRDAVYAKLGTI